MAAPDAMCLDEDGHTLPVMVRINKLTMGAAPQEMMIVQTHGQLFDYIGWVSFNYTLAETYQDAEGNREHCTEEVVRRLADHDGSRRTRATRPQSDELASGKVKCCDVQCPMSNVSVKGPTDQLTNSFDLIV